MDDSKIFAFVADKRLFDTFLYLIARYCDILWGTSLFRVLQTFIILLFYFIVWGLYFIDFRLLFLLENEVINDRIVLSNHIAQRWQHSKIRPYQLIDKVIKLTI